MSLRDKSVLCTGGSGSFGNAFVRKALELGARRVVVFSRSESKQAAMAAEIGDERLRFLIGDVRDKDRVKRACHDVDVVVHAAALKRVETCESDPTEAVLTNILGTENVAKACIDCGVSRAVMLSTDKAAAANTLYGASKMVAERLWLASNVYAAGTVTRFSATRYGNVLASTGSVIPLWRSQVARGQRISITDPEMSRFWMRMDQAVDLVLTALREMRSGEVFIPKIGSSDIFTLAEAIAPDALPVLTGARPGEKRHEVLVSAEEARHTHDCGSYYVISPASRSWGELPPLRFPRVPPGFEYRSDNNSEQLTAEQLREMAA